MSPNVPHLIDLLERTAPDTLASLRAEHPDIILKSGQELGPASKKYEASSQTVFDLVQASHSKVDAELDILIERMRNRMTAVDRVRFFGAILATIAGGLTAILILFLSDQKIANALTAVVAMIGGLASTFADWLARAPTGLRIAGTEEYGKLLASKTQMQTIARQLDRSGVIPVPDSDLHEMLQLQDRIAEQILRLKLA